MMDWENKLEALSAIGLVNLSVDAERYEAYAHPLSQNFYTLEFRMREEQFNALVEISLLLKHVPREDLSEVLKQAHASAMLVSDT